MSEGQQRTFDDPRYMEPWLRGSLKDAGTVAADEAGHRRVLMERSNHLLDHAAFMDEYVSKLERLIDLHRCPDCECGRQDDDPETAGTHFMSCPQRLRQGGHTLRCQL